MKQSLLIVFIFSTNLAVGQPNPWYEQGTKINGKKTGVWTYYDSPDNPGLVYDHTHDSILFIRKDTTKSLVNLGRDVWSPLATDHPARVLGSYEPLYAYLQGTITVYIKKLMKKQGYFNDKVYVGFSINEKGKLSDVSVLRSANQELNGRIISAFLGAPFEWLPAKKKDSAYASILAMPIVLCTSCEQFRPRHVESETIPTPCPILPLLMIQKESIKEGYHTNRSKVVTPQRGMDRQNEDDPGPVADVEWSSNGDQVLFIYEGILYEHMPGKGTTRRVADSPYPKSSLIQFSAGWLYTQENNFGVDEIFRSNADFSEIRNLSHEIKWPEYYPNYNPVNDQVYFKGSKGSGFGLFSIDLATGQKLVKLRGEVRKAFPIVPSNYSLVREHRILHVEVERFYNRFDGTLCLVGSDGKHESLTRPTRGLELEAWSNDQKFIVYSITDENLTMYYQFNLETRSSTVLPITDAGCDGFFGNKLLFNRTKANGYHSNTQFYFYDCITGELEPIAVNLKDLLFMSIAKKEKEALLEMGKHVYTLNLVKDAEPQLLIKQASLPLRQPGGTLVYYVNRKDNLPYLYNMSTQQATPLLPPVKKK